MSFCNSLVACVVALWFCLPLATAQTTRPAPAKPSTAAQVPPEVAKARQQAIDTLIRELGEMMPGGVDLTENRKKAINDFIGAFVDGRGDQALKMIHAQAELDKDFPPAKLVIAALQFSSDNESGARQTLELAAEEHPDDPSVYLAFSRLAINENRNADALAQLEKVERLVASGDWSDVQNDYFRARYLDGLADVKMRHQKWDEAEPLLQEIATTSPNDPKLLVRLAEIRYRKGKIQESLEYLEKFVAALKGIGREAGRKPELMLATWYNRDNQVEDAHKWIVAASKKYPDSVEVTAEYADWMVGRERYAEAQVAIEKIVKEKGETIATKFVKGKIAFAQESYVLAEAHFSSLYLQEPGNFELANLWALALAECPGQKKKQRALQVATRNSQVQPKNGVALGILGWVHYKLGDMSQAEVWLNRATQTRVNSPELSYFIATVMEKRGQQEQAKALLESALKHRGVFLYRSSANSLLKRVIGASSQEQLPEPSK